MFSDCKLFAAISQTTPVWGAGNELGSRPGTELMRTHGLWLLAFGIILERRSEFFLTAYGRMFVVQTYMHPVFKYPYILRTGFADRQFKDKN
jgi:hypothetical protein